MISLGGADQSSPQTYIVAPNPAILAILMRDADTRNTNPSAYTTPASVFNTLAVDFDSDKPSVTHLDPTSSAAVTISSAAADVPLKTVIMPAAELQKLDRMAAPQSSEATTNINNESAIDMYQTMVHSSGVSHMSLDPYNHQATDTIVVVDDDGILCTSPAASHQPVFPVPCEIINAGTQKSHMIDPMYKVIKKTSTSRLVTETPDRSDNQPPPYHQHMLNQSLQPHQSPFSFCSSSIPLSGHFQMSGQYYSQSSYYPQHHQPQLHNPQAAISPTPHCSLPPACQSSMDTQDQLKSRSLERNANVAQITFANRISSLERAQNAAKQQQVRSNSLTRQMSTGQDYASRSGSFDRYQPHQAMPPTAASSVLVQRTNSVERQPIGNCGSASVHMGRGSASNSLERNQTYDLMKSRGYRGGSLERNQQQALMQGVAMISTTSRAGSLDRNPQYHSFRNQLQRTPLSSSTDTTEQPFQEEIYDFGGANVKSCASIALSKSISKGMLPADTILPQSPSTTLQQQQHNFQQQQQPMFCNPSTSPSTIYQPSSTSYPLSPQQQPQHQAIFSPNATYTQMHPRIWPPHQSPPNNNNNTISARPMSNTQAQPTQIRTGASGLPPVGQKPPQQFLQHQQTIPSMSTNVLSPGTSNQVCSQFIQPSLGVSLHSSFIFRSC